MTTAEGASFDQVLAAQKSLNGDAAKAVTGAGSATGTGPAGSSGSAAGSSGSDVVAAGRKYLGVPYVWGGTDPKVGLDCSGFVQRTFKDLGITLPRVADAQAREGVRVPSLAQAQPGDLVAFDRGGAPGIDHIGIYIGDGKMIAAPRSGKDVMIQDVGKPTAIRRIIGRPSGSAPVAAAANGSGTARFDALFDSAGAKYGVPAMLLKAVAKVESGGNPNARSPAGALGLMQLMPGTAKGLGVNPLDPTQAVDGAAKMLSGLIRKFGKVDLALAAYNAGAGAVTKYGGIPPYHETQSYVTKVKSVWAGYR